MRPRSWNVPDCFGIITPCSATYHLKVGAPISLKAATKASLRGKKLQKLRVLDCFSKQKRKSEIKIME